MVYLAVDLSQLVFELERVDQNSLFFVYNWIYLTQTRQMDSKPSIFESGGCAFDPRRGRSPFQLIPISSENLMLRSSISHPKKLSILRRVWKKFISQFYSEQWIILVSQNSDFTAPKWEDFTPLVPPHNCGWADPFPWFHEGKHYIFMEEIDQATGRGHISCLTMDDRLNVLSNQVILKKPYHLSYPFLFKYNDVLYMMPETKENHTIELYRCTEFPHRWEFEKILMHGIDAVDATLINFHQKWWLFANIQERGGSSWDTLWLFHADTPLSDRWIPHPQNPIIQDVSLARPAGHILAHHGSLIRPSQDCSVRYGYATNFNRITTLSETGYAETRESTFTPPPAGKFIGTHTWNQTDGLHVIDALVKKRRFS